MVLLLRAHLSFLPICQRKTQAIKITYYLIIPKLLELVVIMLVKFSLTFLMYSTSANLKKTYVYVYMCVCVYKNGGRTPGIRIVNLQGL